MNWQYKSEKRGRARTGYFFVERSTARMVGALSNANSTRDSRADMLTTSSTVVMAAARYCEESGRPRAVTSIYYSLRWEIHDCRRHLSP
jgi:hypothetical protein